MNNLNFDGLPNLPQIEPLKRIASALWTREDVAALWLGGSFARGKADEYSDLDLRVAVTAMEAWSEPSAVPDAIGETVVGGQRITWEGFVLHHVVLADGLILDLLVQTTASEPPADFTLVLGCRDARLAQRLQTTALPEVAEIPVADPETVRQAVVAFWICSHKHTRGLHRDLDALNLIGLGLEQAMLLRFWHIEATGRDQNDPGGTIHVLTRTIRPVMDKMGAHAIAVLGTPRRNREEILRAIEGNRDEVAQVGRELAATLGFEYPDTLEQTVREAWRRFVG